MGEFDVEFELTDLIDLPIGERRMEGGRKTRGLFSIGLIDGPFKGWLSGERVGYLRGNKRRSQEEKDWGRVGCRECKGGKAKERRREG
jgi:hypothetical protein